jgi:hypothetical protein
MNFKQIIEPVLLQLANTLSKVTDTEYTHKSTLLNGSTIGGHTRHVIEIFQCLIDGYKTGTINYELRKRDLLIETNKHFAAQLLNDIAANIYLPNKDLKLEGNYCVENDSNTYNLPTNFFRELIYNLEHCIHHMALIRVGVQEHSNYKLPDDFGVAPSTIQHKKLCAQ